MKKRKKALPRIGWREWVELPHLGVAAIKAKIDTGARSSALHAFNLRRVERDGQAWVRFVIHPMQRSIGESLEVETPVLEFRKIRSSNGLQSIRPVILTPITLGGVTWPVELTLANRDAMGFRMLLGRHALRNRFLIDAGKSYLQGRRLGHR